MALGQFTAEVEAGLPVVDRTGKDSSIHWECIIITLKILLFHIPKGIKLATHEMKKNSSSKTKPDQTPNSTLCIFSRDTPPPQATEYPPSRHLFQHHQHAPYPPSPAFPFHTSSVTPARILTDN